METMRIALTVLPVGPRGNVHLEANATLTFALQATAGYEPDKKPGALSELWPWSYLLLNGQGPVELSAWRFKQADGTATPLPVAVSVKQPEVSTKFIKTLHSDLESQYDEPDENLNLQLYFPAELSDIANDKGEEALNNILQNNFPSRTSFLSCLPGELSSRLLATVYFEINRDELFSKDADGNWQVIEDYDGLWVAPSSVTRKGQNARFPVEGIPVSAPGLQELLTQSYTTGAVSVFGPGYGLDHYIAPPAQDLFDLSGFWLPVSTGDSRFIELERFLVNVVDPFSELGRLPMDTLSGECRNSSDVVLSNESLRAAQQLWKVQALAGELDWNIQTNTGIAVETLRRLIPTLDTESDVDEVMDEIGKPWQIDSSRSLTDLAADLAGLLGIEVPRLAGDTVDQRSLVKHVAGRANMDGISQFIESALDSALAGGKFKDLADAWDFPVAGGGGLTPTEQRRQLKESKERRRARVQLCVEEAIESTRVANLLARLDQNPADAIAELREAGLRDDLLRKRWELRLSGSVSTALMEMGFSEFPDATIELVLDTTVIDQLTETHVSLVWPVEEKRTEAAGRPIPLLFGNGKHRLLHERNNSAVGTIRGGEGGVLNEVTGHSLLVRRHDTESDLGQAPWRIVSGGVAAFGQSNQLFEPDDTDADKTWLSELLPIAEENVFQNGVLRADRGYDGQLRHIQQPLELAYSQVGESTAVPALDAPPYSYQGLGHYKGSSDEVGEMSKVVKSPPFRFGDWYQFAATMVDAAGGIAPQIAVYNEPWRLDPAKVGKTDSLPGNSKPVPFRRQQPVGEINLLPGEDGQQDWPMTPHGVVTRAREWERAHRTSSGSQGPGNENVPEVLLWDGDEFKPGPDGQKRPVAVTLLEPPSIDEFTLRRWVTPRVSATPDEKKAVREKLREALTNLYAFRGKDSFDPRSMVHDPAISAIGIRFQIFDLAGNQTTKQLVLDFLDSAIPYRRKPIQLNFVADTNSTIEKIEAELEAISSADTSIPLSLPPGWFASIDVWSLVKSADFNERFGPSVLFSNVLEDADYPGMGDFVAFGSSRMLAEVASDQLPTAEALHSGLLLEQDGDNVRISWHGADDESLQTVHKFTLTRDRWAWRNRPVLLEDLQQASPAEKRRLAASGLPGDAFMTDQDDRDASIPLKDWEKLADLDRGFVDRGEFTNSWPRVSPGPKKASGGCSNDTTLLLDNCDGVTAGDYLRFGLVIESRYAPILNQPTRTAERPQPFDKQRRLVMPFRARGAKPKPPKILSVIPLTRSLESDPLRDGLGHQIPDGPTPFLVVVDETWFREYGTGERLEARLVLENLDIGEDEQASDYEGRPYRTGPLPDHWLAHEKFQNYYRGHRRDSDQDAGDPIRLDAFGPFGYSLDTTADEALANASAFVLYPPKDVGPHFASFVQFRRVLDQQSDIIESEPSDIYALYTLPNERRLAAASSEDARLALSPENDEYRVDLQGVRLSLDPLDEWMSDDDDFDDNRARTASTYRYFMLLSESVTAAGEGRNVERPVAVMRLMEESDGADTLLTARPLKGVDLEKQVVVDSRDSTEYFARILEVRVNGIYPNGLSRLDHKTIREDSEGARIVEEISQREFWDQLLTPHHVHRNSDQEAGDNQKRVADKKAAHDAGGMIRRVSPRISTQLIP